MKKEKPTLIINLSNAECANCGRGADPKEKTHKTCLGYGKQPKGCGIKWKYVTTDYKDREKATKKMRPDLKFMAVDHGTPRIRNPVTGTIYKIKKDENHKNATNNHIIPS